MPDTAGPRLAAFRTGRGDEDRLVALLAYALAAEEREAAPAGSAPKADRAERFREQAGRELHDHAFRFLHNRVEEIRAEAVAERLGSVRRPPRFATLVLANLVALALAAAASGWLYGHPAVLARLLPIIGG